MSAIVNKAVDVHSVVRKPDWLKIRLPSGKSYSEIRQIVDHHKLHTICESGRCPNMAECWSAGTATFMILGNICTRSCGFCAVKTGRPSPPDPDEPDNIARSVLLMNLKHCVLTSVDRDDIQDGGAYFWEKTIAAIRRASPETTIEALIPDFSGKMKSLEKIIRAAPEIVSHNLETTRRLTKQVRIHALYDQSLKVINILHSNGMTTKSGIMVGLGETDEEVFETMDDLRNAGCEILTIGQYLQPTKQHLPVERYVHPDTFAMYKETGLGKGFRFVESAPLVRSSYHADKHI